MFIIEGTIGAGKSTFLHLLKKYIPNITTADEPLNAWSSDDIEKSLLAKFYKSQERWAYTIETTAMMTRVRQHITQSNYPNNYHVMERSIYSGHYVFALNGLKNGSFSKMEWGLYLKWFEFLINQKCKPPRGFIYLRVSPNIAYKRIKIRSRSAEKNISLEYLNQIHEHHEQFLINKENILPELKRVPVLVLDCNKEFEHNEAQRKINLERTLSFMQKIHNSDTSI